MKPIFCLNHGPFKPNSVFPLCVFKTAEIEIPVCEELAGMFRGYGNEIATRADDLMTHERMLFIATSELSNMVWAVHWYMQPDGTPDIDTGHERATYVWNRLNTDIRKGVPVDLIIERTLEAIAGLVLKCPTWRCRFTSLDSDWKPPVKSMECVERVRDDEYVFDVREVCEKRARQFALNWFKPHGSAFTLRVQRL